MLNENITPAEHSGIVFLKALYHLIQTAKIYNDNNQLIKECLAKFKDILDEMTQGGRSSNSDLAGKVPYRRRKTSL